MTSRLNRTFPTITVTDGVTVSDGPVSVSESDGHNHNVNKLNLNSLKFEHRILSNERFEQFNGNNPNYESINKKLGLSRNVLVSFPEWVGPQARRVGFSKERRKAMIALAEKLQIQSEKRTSESSSNSSSSNSSSSNSSNSNVSNVTNNIAKDKIQ